ncbi:MAG: lipid-A-disaccharide synthase [Terrimicrobiaceae bacterium]
MTFWVVAGESSGDARAEELLKALRQLLPTFRFHGAGGPRMAALAEEPFDDWIAEAGVVGLWDVLRHYGYFRKKFHGMLLSIEETRPDAVLLVDYPGFNLRLARRLRKEGYSGRILYYISPQVWAWNRGRIAKMATFLDLMICVFPFEQPMYEASGLKTVFAGHPLLEALVPEKSDTPRQSDLVGLFPGSRRREVQRIFPAQLEAARILLAKRPATQFEAAASSEAHAEIMRGMARDFPVTISSGHARELMRRASAGIVCSGTATLEAAFFGLPYCLIYKTAWLTFAVGRHLVDVDCLGIVNILNNYRLNPPADPRLPARPAPHVVREFIQDAADPEEMAAEVARLLDDHAYAAALQENFRNILGDLEAEGASGRAARAILDHLYTDSTVNTE